MPCNCAEYQPIELDRQSINRRIKESAAIRKRITLLSENTGLRLYLFRCSDCGVHWQSGHEWNFADQEYLFQVPPIEVADWLNEPYQQPAAMMIYSALMRDYFARTSPETDEKPCRKPECTKPALRVSLFCREHHVKSLQQAGRLPKRPAGRMFPPYFVEPA
jgi:hypothetical protein